MTQSESPRRAGLNPKRYPRPVQIGLAAALVLAVLWFVGYLVPEVLVPSHVKTDLDTTGSLRSAEIARTRTASLAVLAGLLAGFSAWLGYRNHALARQEHRVSQDNLGLAQENLQLARKTQQDAREADAARRDNESYVAAIGQLSSDPPAARIAGLHALDRLGQGTPDLRPVVVDVWCAYLRLPAGLSDAPTASEALSWAERQEAKTADKMRQLAAKQEREVRTTAQRLLLSHFREAAGDRYWDTAPEALSVDLTSAELHSLDASSCHFREISVVDAIFHGHSDFSGARFSDSPVFFAVQFLGRATFDRTTFNEVSFVRCDFASSASFEKAKVEKVLLVHQANFGATAGFDGARVGESAYFSNTRFTGRAHLRRIQLPAKTTFRSVLFSNRDDFSHANLPATAVITKTPAEDSDEVFLKDST